MPPRTMFILTQHGTDRRWIDRLARTALPASSAVRRSKHSAHTRRTPGAGHTGRGCCAALRLAAKSVRRNSSRQFGVAGLEICCAEMGGRATTGFYRVLIRANRGDTDSSVYINNPVVCKRRHFCAVSVVEDALINAQRQSYYHLITQRLTIH
jgi:hypothetical protein